MADAKTCLRVVRESGRKIEMNVCKDKFNPEKENESKKVEKNGQVFLTLHKQGKMYCYWRSGRRKLDILQRNKTRT